MAPVSSIQQQVQALANILGPAGRYLLRAIGGRNPNLEQLRAIEQAIGILRPDLVPGMQRARRRADRTRGTSPPLQSPSHGFDTGFDSGRPSRPERPERRMPFAFRGNPDDPIYRGEMIPVTSSNVHSIGYLWNDDAPSKGTLIVRFLQKTPGAGKTAAKKAGPEYRYYDVHPLVFDAFRRASSKGGFVWDRLRVRGTVSGHQFKYQLTGITGGYVPRQAKRYGDHEYFIRRQVTGQNSRGERRTFQSGRPDQYVGRINSVALFPGGRRVPLVQR